MRTHLNELISIAEDVLEAGCDAITVLLGADPVQVKGRDPVLRRKLSEIFYAPLNTSSRRSSGADPHLVTGLFSHGRAETVQDPGAACPRLADLMMMLFDEAQRGTSHGGVVTERTVFIPSPLHFCIDAMTDPQAPQTQAWASYAARTILARRLLVWTRPAFGMQFPPPWIPVDYQVVDRELAFAKNYLAHRDTAPVGHDATKRFVYHYLGAKGIVVFRLAESAAANFLGTGLFSRNWRGNQPDDAKVEIALSPRYAELPETQAIANELLGVPIAIRGADNVFFGGLRPSTSQGLVLQITGGPGTGKTSLALALASSLAPLDAKTLYLSFEEGREDLEAKLRAQTPARAKRLSFHYKDDLSWFNAEAVRGNSLQEMSGWMARMATGVRSLPMELQRIAHAGAVAVPPVPLVVVLDSISALSSRDSGSADTLREQLTRLVNACRDVSAMVILVSGDSDPTLSTVLDFLVDVAIALRVDNADDIAGKPARRLTVKKARHQIIRHGTHGLHLSGEHGVRFAAQLPSQMESKRVLLQHTHDPDTVLHSLSFRWTSDTCQFRPALPVCSNSRVLIHGRGSGGKAGLAMKLALSPRFRIDKSHPGPVGELVPGGAYPRVLIVSFLYPESYYAKLRDGIARLMAREYDVIKSSPGIAKWIRGYRSQSPACKVLHFAPGYLSAEDLYSRIERTMEAGRLEGWPYGSVVLDGLHNLALQFPGARETDSLWPIVYGTLARANVITITTFTSLHLVEHGSAPTETGSPRAYGGVEDSEFRLRGHIPLLNTLVQATDYSLEISKAGPPGSSQVFYELRVASAISRDLEGPVYGWSRQDLKLLDYGLFG